MNRIVVGTDGSQYAETAMRWATDEAALHGSTLEAVLVWHYLDQHHPDHSDTFQSDYTEGHARAALAAWVTEALGEHATVDQRVVVDLPARALLEASDAADLLVLGARGTGGFEGLLFGSVSERVAQLATRPVAVIRAATPVGGGRVVVGVDGSARSRHCGGPPPRPASRDADLDVVHAWRLPIMAVPPATMALTDYAALEDSGRAVLDAALGEPDLAGLRVHPHFVHDSPGRALIDAPRVPGSSSPAPAVSAASAGPCSVRSAASYCTMRRAPSSSSERQMPMKPTTESPPIAAKPLIVLSASGMLTGGRVLHHLIQVAPDHRNTILLAGFQAAGTRGEALLHGASTLRIVGDDIPVRARIIHLDSLSAHADADALLAWLASAPTPPASVSIVHGEPAQPRDTAATHPSRTGLAGNGGSHR